MRPGPMPERKRVTQAPRTSIIKGTIMVTKLLTSGLLATVVLGVGCASSSIRSDLRRVRSLSQAPVLASVNDSKVSAESDERARELLEKPLDADAVVRVALLNNRELRAQLRELGVARGRLVQAGLVANPTVEAELVPERDSDVELRVEYDISSLVLAPLAARAAESELKATRLQTASAVMQLGYQARIAFYALQAAEQRLLLAQQTLDTLAAARDAAVALLEAGNIPELAAASQITAFERARISVAQLELELAAERERMQRLLGLHGKDTQWTIRREFPELPEELALAEKLETRALESSLELKAMRSRLDGAARRTGLARTQGLLPEVAVDVHALHVNPEEDDDTNWRWGGGISVGVPLFDRNQGTRRMVEAEFDALLERYQGTAVDLRSAVRDARNRVVSAHGRARQYERVIVPAQRTVLEQTLLQYNAMQVSVFQLLEARREQLDVELSRIDTLREYFTAAATLDALLAGSLVTLPSSGMTSPSLAGNGSKEEH